MIAQTYKSNHDRQQKTRNDQVRHGALCTPA
jgi:hypothetical protein